MDKNSSLKFSLVIAVAPERNAEVISSLNKVNYPLNKTEIIIEKGKNPSDNRNKGFNRSRGEIIGFIDDDGAVEKDVLKNAEQFFLEHPEVDIVGGVQKTPLDEKGFAKISGYAFECIFGAWKMCNRYNCNIEVLNADETSITSAILFCRRKVLEKVSFDPKLFPGEDPKFISDAKKAGFKVALSPRLILYHRRRSSIKSLSKQIFNYGKVRPLKEDLRDTIRMPFFFVPSLFILYLLSLILIIIILLIKQYSFISIIDLIVFQIIAIPFLLYILLSLSFSLYFCLRKKDISAFILPVLFLIIHLSYGTGMIYGYYLKLFKRK